MYVHMIVYRNAFNSQAYSRLAMADLGPSGGGGPGLYIQRVFYIVQCCGIIKMATDGQK